MTNMRYVDRDKDDNISGMFVREQYEGQERVSYDNKEVQDFVNRGIIGPNEAKIQVEIVELNRVAAIQSLKDKGELSQDYMDDVK